MRRVVAALAAIVILGTMPGTALAANDFPANHEGYHSYAEMTSLLDDTVAAHPGHRAQGVDRPELPGPPDLGAQDQRQRRHRRRRAGGPLHLADACPRVALAGRGPAHHRPADLELLGQPGHTARAARERHRQDARDLDRAHASIPTGPSTTSRIRRTASRTGARTARPWAAAHSRGSTSTAISASSGHAAAARPASRATSTTAAARRGRRRRRRQCRDFVLGRIVGWPAADPRGDRLARVQRRDHVAVRLHQGRPAATHGGR